MIFNAKKLKYFVKWSYYQLTSPDLYKTRDLELAYIFHTENIFDADIFYRLIHFCKRYQELTGQRPICAVMPAINLRVRKGMIKSGVTQEEYVARVKALSQYATIGYHGHFWFSPQAFDRPEAEIRCNNFNRRALLEQLEADLMWFRSNGIEHNGIYAAGWWVMNAAIQKILMDHDFKYDFSFSQSIWFRNQYSYAFMREHQIRAGESFIILSEASSGDSQRLYCVQNLIGCHDTPFVEDFERNLKKLLGDSGDTACGVINAHDFDLDFANTVRCLEHLTRQKRVKFHGFESLSEELKKQKLRSFKLSNGNSTLLTGSRPSQPVTGAPIAGV